MWPSTTSGAAANAKVETGTNHVNYYVLDFADGSTLTAEGGLVMPSDWDGGTITATFTWLANDTTNNSVVWGCAARAFGDGDAIDAAYGTQQTVTDANASTANQVRQSAATPAITVAGTPAASKYVQFQIQRLGGAGGDTLAATARLLGVMITYTRA